MSFARTPIGSFTGSLASVPATKLGAIAVKEAVQRAGMPSLTRMLAEFLNGAVLGLKPDQIQEAIIGNVVSAGLGQAPARQAVLGAGMFVRVCFCDVLIEFLQACRHPVCVRPSTRCVRAV